MGIEPTTYSLGSCRSATELRPRRRDRSLTTSDQAARPVLVSFRKVCRRCESSPSLQRGSSAAIRSRGFVESKLRHAAESKLRHAHKQNAAGVTERSPAPPSRTTNSTSVEDWALDLLHRWPEPPNRLNAISFLRRKALRKRLLGCARRPK
jgi:hypothetical protein